MLGTSERCCTGSVGSFARVDADRQDVRDHRHAGLTFGWPPFSAWHVGSYFSACYEKVVRHTE